MLIRYRKLIGQGGGVFTIGSVITISGSVSVLSIVTASLVVVLQLTYSGNGDIDASGRFSIEVRISKFFKVRADGEARYQMRGGQSQSSSSTSVKSTADEVKNALGRRG